MKRLVLASLFVSGVVVGLLFGRGGRLLQSTSHAADNQAAALSAGKLEAWLVAVERGPGQSASFGHFQASRERWSNGSEQCWIISTVGSPVSLSESDARRLLASMRKAQGAKVGTRPAGVAEQTLYFSAVVGNNTVFREKQFKDVNEIANVADSLQLALADLDKIKSEPFSVTFPGN